MKIQEKVIGKHISFKNRLIMPPMATAKADEKGHITEEYLSYYDEKTKSELFAAVIVEHSYVEKRGQAHKNQTSIAKDEDVAGMKQLVRTIQKNCSLAILQLAHAGSAAKEEVTGQKPVGPSAIVNPGRKEMQVPKELTKEEIQEIKHRFIQAAKRAKAAGFDGVEIHSAHGYLLDQFLSPLSNQRQDEYGRDIYGRIKLHLDIIRGIKEELGETYPVFMRMGAGDFMEGGISKEDSVIAAKEFEKAGVDVIDISGGMCMYSISDTRAGYFDVLSKPIFDVVNIPVILTGGVQTGKDVIDILDRNVCDLIGIGRVIYKNSSWLEEEIQKLK